MARPTRPTSVKGALGLLGGVLVVSIGITLFVNLRPSQPGFVVGLVGAALAGLAFAGLTGLLAAIAFGRRWALIVFTVLFACSLPAPALSLARQHHSPADFVWQVATTALEAIAIGLLFSRSARAWFAAVESRQVFFGPRAGQTQA
jgi:hypothetical protein